MKLRFKILSGFLTLALMLVLAGVWSIFELSNVGESAPKLLRENYQSINAAQTMLEALEREDSAILLLLLGKWKEGRAILTSGDSLFEESFQVAQNNLTIPGEKTITDSIAFRYKIYKGLWEKPIVSTAKEGNLDWYFGEVHRAFLQTKAAVNKLMHINSNTMYQTATRVKERANRAIMPGIVAMIAAVVFALLFNFFVNHYIVTPIIRINRSLDAFLKEQKPIDLEIESNDELKELGNLILTLSARAGKPGNI